MPITLIDYIALSVARDHFPAKPPTKLVAHAAGVSETAARTIIKKLRQKNLLPRRVKILADAPAHPTKHRLGKLRRANVAKRAKRTGGPVLTAP